MPDLTLPAEPIDMTTPIRLSKRMAELRLCSRREADEWISKGWVTVDGVPVTALGSKVTREQAIAVLNPALQAQGELATVIVHKPVGFVSGQAEHGYRHAIELVTEQNRDPNYPGQPLRREHLRSLVAAGRLDIDSTGLLVLTQDGRVARQLIGEDREVDKEYLVRVRGEVNEQVIAKLRFGLAIDGEALLPAEVEQINQDQLRFVLREGKKRQIRKMCRLVELHVVGLKRVRIGQVRLGKLELGKWRFLRPGEHF